MPETVSLFEWRAAFGFWAPRLLGAILIMAAAYALGLAAKWAIAKLIDRIPALNRPAEGQPQGPTVGAQLGNLANWLILLIGLISALGVLGLDYIVAPLNGLLASVLNFIPNLIGAGLIFFVGYIVATLAKRVVQSALSVAGVDRALERAGLTRMTGASGLAKTLGTIVFVLIIVPVSIAALEQLGVRAISDPAVSVLRSVLDALPRVLAASVVLAIAFLIARWVASLIEQILPSLGVDRSLSALGLFRSSSAPTAAEATATPAAPPAMPMTPSRVIAQVVLWAIMLFAATEAARLLNFTAVSVMLQQILQLFGRVVFGGVVIAVGVLLANFLSGLVARTGSGEGFASTMVRWATIALATAMGLTFMGIAPEIVTLAFGLILGSAAVAAAIAFGIGGREPAKRLLERAQQRAEARTDAKPPAEPPQPPDSPLVG